MVPLLKRYKLNLLLNPQGTDGPGNESVLSGAGHLGGGHGKVKAAALIAGAETAHLPVLLNDGDLHPVVRKPRPAGKPPHPAANYDRIKSVTHLSPLSFHACFMFRLLALMKYKCAWSGYYKIWARASQVQRLITAADK
jgi:hypothetical protein